MSFFTVLLLVLAIALVIGLFLLWFLGQNKSKAGEAKTISGNEQSTALALKASVTALNKKLDLLH